MTQSALCVSGVCFASSLSTSKERDTESGNDYFGARYYASTMGRFLSADWSAKVEPAPYSKLDNPQTLSLYAYLGNNPLAGVDADGHAACAGDDGSTTGEAGQSGVCNVQSSTLQQEALELWEEFLTHQPMMIVRPGESLAQQNTSDKNTDVMLMSNHATPQVSESNNAGQTSVQWHLVPQADNIADLSRSAIDAVQAKYSQASILLDEAKGGPTKTGPYQWTVDPFKVNGYDNFDPSALPVNQK